MPELNLESMGGIDVAFFSRDVFEGSTRNTLSPQARVFFELLDGAKSLKWLHVFSAGADRPQYAELMDRGVVVTTSAGANGNAVATMAIAGLLALSRRLPHHMKNQHDRVWSVEPMSMYPVALSEQTAVIVGTGHVGVEVARYANFFGLRTIGINRSGRYAECFESTYGTDQLGAVAGNADWLIVCCPLTDDTRNLVSAEILAALPPHANVINVGRGGVMDQSALTLALQGKHLAGAHLDVFDPEPLSPGSPLWLLDNVIITPHAAAQCANVNAQVFELFLDNLQGWITGAPLRNGVGGDVP